MATGGARKKVRRTLDTRPDTLDFRDKMFEASLCEVPTQIDLDEYRRFKVPVLDQGQEVNPCSGWKDPSPKTES